ncbi:MAG TPA: toll/interleukin-1 receptor domain-containing protein, partial [Pyrinomonadaceae bacterium]|nr:toll/interleukin-1 receptor domain-containing protein [Pyrinomonadaceae bacterium]
SVLGEALGYEPKIWRDPRLPGNAYFADVLEERIQQTAVVISILSPGYIQSDWCLGELREFCRLADRSGGLRVADRMRVFKVVKTHVERELHPPEFQQQLGYEFYEIDKATQRPVAFGQELGRSRDQRYWSKLDDLAWDVKQVLSIINPRAKIPAQGSVFSRALGAVYLAQTTRDLSGERDQIKRELQNRGYDILPETELPFISPNYEQAVRECVGRAKLSVHLIGGSYGIVPEGAGNRSIVRLQNEIAAERNRHQAFSRLLWMPVGLTPREEVQAQFIEHLRTDATTQQGAELLQTPLEELKNVIQLRLSSNGVAAKAERSVATPRKIYLIFDKRDFDGILPLNDYLKEKNYDVLLPLIDDEGADDAEGFETHKDNLAQCDAILIYYGNGNQVWFDYKRRDVKKMVGLDRKSLLAAEAVYVTSPKTAHKQLFSSPETLVIKNFEDFSPAALDSFLARVQTAAKGTDNAGN